MAGVKELKDNEVIITNTVSDRTRYGDKLKITNYKVRRYI